MSVLNIKNKWIFIHNPKTGGTSMKKAPFLKMGVGQHKTLSEYRDFMKMTDLRFKDFDSHMFVRDPYTRFVSSFLHLGKRLGRVKISMQEQQRVRAIELFASDVVKDKDHWFENPVLKPQHHFGCVDGKLAVKNIYRFEEIERDWTIFCLKVKQEAAILPLRNISGFNDYTPMILAVKRIIEELYEKDFEMFGYKKI